MRMVLASCIERTVGLHEAVPDHTSHGLERSGCGWCDYCGGVLLEARFSGLSLQAFDKLVPSCAVRASMPRVAAGRGSCRWSIVVLLVAAYWRTHLTVRQLAALFGVSKSAADRDR